ncbi:unnamed protein product [Callosobruchus maculatus]|nr:unnamed protein product [Callosobruchus maculatus]
MRMEVRPIGRADPSLSQTHGRQAVQVPALRPLLQPQRSSGEPYETARLKPPPRSSLRRKTAREEITLEVSSHRLRGVRSNANRYVCMAP